MQTRNLSQTTRALLMLRPAHFGPNAETAASNAFQRGPGPADGDLAAAARREFDQLAEGLRRAGARPFIAHDSPKPEKPDAVFPNNWVSFHGDGSVVLYPLAAPGRRAERRIAILEQLAEAGLIRLDRLIDLSRLEQQGLFLEGTGSLVMDRPRGRAYAALSGRTHAAAIAEFTRLTNIEVLAFHAADSRGLALYHTNVMLSVGERFVVICAEAIVDPAERAAVLKSLAASGREIVEISQTQVREFCANVLEVGAGHGGRILAMSARARQAFSGEQIARLQRYADILVAPIPTIERIGGGSVRCMLAEVFGPGLVD